MRLRRLFAHVFLGLCVDGAVKADSKSDLSQYLAQHDYRSVTVDTGNNREIVEAKVNGKRVSLVVDTGCGRTTLRAACARHLGLDVHDSGEQTWGVGGMIKEDMGIALINSFQLSNFDINRTNTIQVFPKSNSWDDADGLLGFDFLHLNAVLLPVGASFFLFKPGTRPVPNIDHFMDLAGFKSMPLHYFDGGFRILGHVNGRPFEAIVDCGATYSVFDGGYLRKMGESYFRPLKGNWSGVDGRNTPSFGFTPKQLSLGTLDIKPVEVTMIEQPYFTKEGANALLGFDILGKHDAIVDLGHDVLWMK